MNDSLLHFSITFNTINAFVQACPSWTRWGDWSSCSLTCGGGQRYRERLCNNGYEGDPGCEGLTRQLDTCSTQVIIFLLFLIRFIVYRYRLKVTV